MTALDGGGGAGAGGDADLAAYLTRPIEQPDPEVLAAIAQGPIDRRDALPRSDMDRLLDPNPLAAENGWCTLADGVAYVAVRTAMPRVTAKMLDWWFDWHPRDPMRYRVWHPLAHRDNSLEPAPVPRAKAHWGTVHHPVEDVGTGVVHARIAFCAPTEIGMATDALGHPDVATIVCGRVGDDRRRVQHSVMVHVFLRDAGRAAAGGVAAGDLGVAAGGVTAGEGLVLRSRFWLGSAIRPYLPGPLAALGAVALNHRVVRRFTLPRKLPEALARHCAEEYTNLGALLPGLHARFALPAPPG